MEDFLIEDLEMAEVIIWFFMMLAAMGAFFVWEYFVKLGDRE